MAPNSVFLFNADTQNVNVTVNNGTSFTISGTNASIFFIPQTPATEPSFSLASPSPGVFGLGTNSLTIAPQDANTPAALNVVIPVQDQLISLQLYIFWESNVSVGYVLLNNGAVIGSLFVPWSGSP